MIIQTLTTSFKVQLLQGIHNFGPTSANTFKIALYSSIASLNAGTTVYSTTDEITGTGYTAGGKIITIAAPPSSEGTTAFVTFNNAVWPVASFVAAGALIYNSSQGNKSVAVLNFGGNKVTSGSFTIQFPSATATTAIIRVA